VRNVNRQDTSALLRHGVVVVFATTTAIYDTCLPIADNDLWGHVYFGRMILASGHLPLVNQFSYTAPHYPWINHEILAECAFALAFGHLSSAGLLALKLAVGLVTVGLMAKAIARRGASLAATAASLLICGSLLSPGFLVRPQIFTFLSLAFLWERIDAHDGTRDWRSLAPVPLLFVLWINTHGGVVAGVGVFFVYVAASCLSRARRSERPALALVSVLSVLALLINPYGTELLTFLVHDLARDRAISEWQPIAPLAFSGVLYECVLAVLAVGFLAGGRTRAWEGGILALAAVMAFRHQRHLPLFAILAAPLFAETLDALAARIRGLLRIPPLSTVARSMLAAGLCAIAIFQVVRVREIYRGLGLQIFVAPELFPVDAVRFIKRNRLAGNLAVPSDWGEYAIWHLYPGCRVSVDGRYTTAYPDDVLALSLRFQAGSPGWEAMLLHADLALIDRRQPIVPRMFEDPGWQYVYSDPTALVFVRKDLTASRSFVREPRTEADKAFYFP
jgi:hypothetical protein